MKFHDSFLDEIRARVPVSQVVSRRVPLKRRGREFVGLSPFNKEKTPSFTVNDQKGFYHCFSSGKHGDQFNFIMETEGLTFPEAVERLAGEAGLPLPKPDPQLERIVREQLGLFDALEAAAQYFEKALTAREGRDALIYAERRGLRPETLQEFRVGYAPSARDALKSALIKKGFTEAQLLDAGLIIKPDDGRPSYDRFRNRLTIPILDGKSRVIGFGARALDAQAAPKYLNSPETRLFDKGSTVFNFARARKAAFEKGELIVVEGYMDVIALHQAGFENAVATLGTAFTERQMEQLWLLAPEPVICFDGDKAGEAAAERAIDRMLPMLRQGHSFRFAFMPQGLDPDDLLRSKGATAFASTLKEAIPLADAFWRRETRSSPIDTPEQKAVLELRMQANIETIRDPVIRKHYRLSTRIRLSRLFWEYDRSVNRKQQSGLIPDAEGLPLERLVLGMLVEFPELFDRHLERIREMNFSKEYEEFKVELQRIIQLPMDVKIASFYETIKPKFYRMLADEIHGEEKPEKGLRRGHKLFERFPLLKKHPPFDFVEGCLLLFLDRLQLRGYLADLEEAMRDFQRSPTPSNESRLLRLREQEEIQRHRIDACERELDEQAATFRAGFDDEDSPGRSYRGKTFEETIAKVRSEIISFRRERRSYRQA